MKYLSLILACALVACGQNSVTKPESDAGTESITIEVGSGYLGFEPLAEGAEVEIVHGPQGGYHIWGAVRAQGLATGPAKVTYKVALTESPDEALSSSDYLFDVTSDPWEWAGIVGLVPDPDVADGQSVVLSFAIEDAQGRTASASKVVSAKLTDLGAPRGDRAPEPRGDFAAVLDAEGRQLILFGGDPGVPVQCFPTPQFSGETWTFNLDSKQWTKLDIEGPSARSRHVGAFDSKRRRFLVFGGRYRARSSGLYTMLNDTWAFDIALQTWSKLPTTGETPPGLSNSLAVYDPEGDRLIVFAGNSSADGLSLTPRTEAWILSLADNRWSLPVKSYPYPERLYHAGIWNPVKQQLVVFGGAGRNAFEGPFYRDVWAFDVATEEWTRITPEGTPPAGRIRSHAVYDPENHRMLLFGGHDDTEMGERNDLWALELEPYRWVQLREGDTLNNRSSAFCDFPADFTTPDLESPERRESAFFGYDSGTKQFVLYGGKTDCGNIGDVWTLSSDATTWTEQLGSFVGESCARSGRQSCSSLCF